MAGSLFAFIGSDNKYMKFYAETGFCGKVDCGMNIMNIEIRLLKWNRKKNSQLM